MEIITFHMNLRTWYHVKQKYRNMRIIQCIRRQKVMEKLTVKYIFNVEYVSSTDTKCL